jgi:hypothetical protein
MTLFKVKELQFKTCIGNFFDYSVLSLLDVHDKLEKGILPYPGSYMDQPSKMMEVMRIISNHKNDQIVKAQSEQVKKAKGPQPRSVRRG